MNRLVSLLRVPNIEKSIGMPDWFDTDAINDFLSGGSTETRADHSCAVGYRTSPDGGCATCFVLIGDGDEYPSWMPDALEDAVLDAGRHGAIRFDAWVPAWNLQLKACLESVNFIQDGVLRDVIHAWNRRWSVNIYACEPRQPGHR